jgi:hypothetical protein
VNLELFEREITDLNKRFLSLCLRMRAEDELQTCLHMNLDMKFLRAIKSLTLDEIEFITKSYKCLVKPAISDWELRVASKMLDPDVKTMYFFGKNI